MYQQDAAIALVTAFQQILLTSRHCKIRMLLLEMVRPETSKSFSWPVTLQAACIFPHQQPQKGLNNTACRRRQGTRFWREGADNQAHIT